MSTRAGDETANGARGGARPATGPAGAAPGAVRPFLLTEGRVVAAGAELPMETQVVATTEGLHQLGALAFERRAIVEACGTPLSLAELAVRLGLHLNVVRVLAGDLRAGRFLAVHEPQAALNTDVDVLRRVINGLRAIPTGAGRA
jgi:hypothetical protein